MIENISITQETLASSDNETIEEEKSLAEKQNSKSSKSKRIIMGRVISDRMNKTITVLIVRRIKDKIYKKYVTRSTKLHVHDEMNQCKIGDTVAIEECRPLSRTKSWRLQSIIERATFPS